MRRGAILFWLTVLASKTRLAVSHVDSGEEYSIRLVLDHDVDGNGVLEVTYNGTSGGICPDGWDDRDARVACRELGFQHGTARFKLKSLAGIDGPYMTSNFNCTGTETTLGQCSFTPFGQVQECETHLDYDQLAGVRCHDFDVQLFPNPGSSYGAVVFNRTNGSKLLCSHGFDDNVAQVVCHQLGFQYGLSACCSAFGPVDFHPDIQNRFTTDTVKCDGTERHLSECTFWNEVGDTYCTRSVYVGNECLQYCKTSPGSPCNKHYEKISRCTWSRYAGVVCSDERKGMIRVTADPIVKINYFNHDGYVCSEEFTDSDASVVCKSVGFRYGISFKASSSAVLHEVRWLRGLGCSGTESSVEECRHHEWGKTQNCQWDSVAAVMCSNKQGDLDLKVRVVGGSENKTPEDTSVTGRVEIYLNGKWGTICGRYLNHTEARVLCRHLGFHGGKKLQAGRFGPGSGSVLISGIDCEGNEASIRECVWYGYNQNTCGHSEDAAIRCFKGVRLAGTQSQKIGILEMFDYGYNFPDEWWNITDDSIKWFDIDWILWRNVDTSKWWTVCDTNVYLDAAFLCKQWGYPTGMFLRGSALGPSTAELSDVERYCSDSTDTSCPYNKFTGTCSSGKYMTLYCGKSNIDKEEFEVSLPENSFYGPVMVKRYGLTGYICSVGFDDKDAHVVCSQLGFTSGKAVQTLASDLAIIQGAVECKGSEASLETCTRGAFNDGNICSVTDTVAAVICYKDVGPTFVETGADMKAALNTRIKVIVDNSSIFASASNFDDIDASLYCRNIGYAGGKMIVNTKGPYGKYHVHSLRCLGNESSLLECPAIWDPRFVSIDDDFLGYANCRPEIYLHGSNQSYYGAVVVTTKYGTGLVSRWGFGEQEAQYVCNALGFERSQQFCCDPLGPLSEQVFLARLHCQGNSNIISKDCTYEVAYSYTHGLHRQTNYATVVCSNASSKSDYSLSVHQGGVIGPLILTFMNVRGIICSDGWDDRDANVACRELGLHGGMAYSGAISSITFNEPFWTSNIDCNGTENQLGDCNFTLFGQVNQCQNKPGFASVICYGREGIKYRLVGNEARQGLVQMGLFGEWKSICAKYWTNADAHVLCRMLGYATGERTEVENQDPVWNVSFNCNRTGKSLNDCWDMEHTCLKTNIGAGAFCYKSVKLSTVIGRKRNYGEVLLYHNSEWHSVCTDDFTKTSAVVVCKELGFVDGSAVCCSQGGSLGNVPKLQTQKVVCTGSETAVADCLVEGSCKGQGHAYVECYDTLHGGQAQEKSSNKVVLAVVVTILAVVCVGGIIFITVICIRRKKTGDHNVSVRYSPTPP